MQKYEKYQKNVSWVDFFSHPLHKSKKNILCMYFMGIKRCKILHRFQKFKLISEKNLFYQDAHIANAIFEV
jgi:hypothetical protein